MDGVLTKDECELVLTNYSKEKGKDARLTSYKIKSLSGTVEGFIGEHYSLLIADAESNSELRFFLKVLNGCEAIFKISQSISAYEKEEFFYKYLRRVFKENGVDHSYSPEIYLCAPYKIVLEDLGVRGYRSVAKGEFFDVAHCETGLRTLAKFHASGIVYEKLANVKLNVKFPEIFKETAFHGENELANKWLNCSFIGILSVIDHLDLPPAKKANLKTLLKTIKDNIFDTIKPKINETNTILHADLWLNNLLFLYQNQTPVDSILIDYQLLKYGNPAQDVLQFIYSNTRKSLRDSNNTYHNLLNFYYSSLKEILKNSNVVLEEIMPKKDFVNACDSHKATLKLLVVADRSTTLLSEEIFAKVAVSEASLESFLFENRETHIMEAFGGNEKFRAVIEEDLLELAEMI